MQIFMIPCFFVIFFAYILYRAFITKDLKNRRWELYTGLIFLVLWALIFLGLSHA